MSSISRRDIIRQMGARSQNMPEKALAPHYEFLDNYRVSIQPLDDAGRHLVWVKGQEYASRRLTPMQIAETIPGAASHAAFASYKLTAGVPTACPVATKVHPHVFSQEAMKPCGNQKVWVNEDGICTSEHDPNAVTPTTFHNSAGTKRCVDMCE